MANHGYVKTGNTLDFEEVKSNVKDINEKFFENYFEIKSNSEHLTFHLVNEKDQLGIYFFLSDEKEYGKYDNGGVWQEYINPITLSENSVIEFRHGHGGVDFLWWVESVFRHNLAHIYNGKITDDGHELVEDPNTEKVKDYWTYITHGYDLSDKKVVESLHKRWSGNKILSEELIPKELSEKYNLFPNIYEELRKIKLNKIDL